MAFIRHLDLFSSLWTGNRLTDLMKLESLMGNSLIYDENAVETIHRGWLWLNAVENRLLLIHTSR